MKIVAEKDRLGMYFIEWEDGSRSESFYNLTRATELLRRLEAGEKESAIRIGFVDPIKE